MRVRRYELNDNDDRTDLECRLLSQGSFLCEEYQTPDLDKIEHSTQN